MYATYDTHALRLKDWLATLFWASLLIHVDDGRFAFVGAAAAAVVAVTLYRLRAADDDPGYRRRLLLASVAAAVLAVGTLPAAWLLDDNSWYGLTLSVTALLETVAVILAMSRLTETWGAVALARHWRRAQVLVVASLVLLVVSMALIVVLPFSTGPAPGFRAAAASTMVFFFLGLAVALAGAVQFYVALWQTRTAAGRAALVAPAGVPVAL